jgi:hypothetical protein
MRRTFTLLFCILAGLGIGYLLWGARVAKLTESLNSMVLETDNLRSRLASSSNGHDFKELYKTLARKLDLHHRRMDEQTDALDRLVNQNDQPAQSDLDLEACGRDRERLVRWVDACLSAKAQTQTRPPSRTQAPAASIPPEPVENTAPVQ